MRFCSKNICIFVKKKCTCKKASNVVSSIHRRHELYTNLKSRHFFLQKSCILSIKYRETVRSSQNVHPRFSDCNEPRVSACGSDFNRAQVWLVNVRTRSAVCSQKQPITCCDTAHKAVGLTDCISGNQHKIRRHGATRLLYLPRTLCCV